MNVQETVDSLRKVLERDLQENGQSIDRLDARVDRLTGRMEEGFSRMDTRLDALTSAILNMRQPTYPDAVLTRLEKLEREIENLRKQA